MSHYAEVKMKIKDEELLISAVKKIFGSSNVEVHKNPVNLIDYYNVTRDQKANIIVRKQHVGPTSNDIGWLRNNDGTYTAIYDKYSAERYNNVAVEYTAEMIRNRAPHKFSIQNITGNKIKLLVRN